MRKYLIPTLALMIVALAGFTVGFMLSFGNGGVQQPQLAMVPPPLQPHAANPSIDQNFEYEQSNAPEHSTPQEARISAETIMIYEYYFPETGDFRRIEESPAPFLLGMTAQELSVLFADWQVLSFAHDEVHLRQSNKIEHRQYIIGVHNGYIAVFYDNEHYSIKELTSRPIAALAAEEQERLYEGIRVVGNDELMRALEDFSS